MTMRDAGRQLATMATELADFDYVELTGEPNEQLLRTTACYLDPTDDQLATDAGTYVAELFGMSRDVRQVQMMVARAQHVFEHRKWEQTPRDWAIVAFIGGRLGPDWAKERT